MTPDLLLFAAVALPAFAAVAMLVVAQHPLARDVGALISAVVLLLLTAAILAMLDPADWLGVILAPLFAGVPVRLVGEPVGATGALLASFAWLIAVFWSLAAPAARRPRHPTRFFVCGSAGMAAAVGCLYAGNLLSQITFEAGLLLATSLMLAPSRNEEETATHPILLLLIAAMFLAMVAAAWTFLVAGSVEFRPGGSFAGATDRNVAGLILAIFALAGTRFALLPGLRGSLVLGRSEVPVQIYVATIVVLIGGAIPFAKATLYVIGPATLREIGGIDVIGTLAIAALLVLALRLRGAALAERALGLPAVQTIAVAVTLFSAHQAGTLAALIVLAAGVLAVLALLPVVALLADGLGPTIATLRGEGSRTPWLSGCLLAIAASLLALPPTAGFIGTWYGVLTTATTAVTGPIVLGLAPLVAAIAVLPMCQQLLFARPDVSSLRQRLPLGWTAMLPALVATVVLLVAPAVIDQMLPTFAGLLPRGP
ncbi:MAG: hypothetical protein FJX65_06655 [Alphaproteobacteria bacterium]|nr:hypothetical protein [Alphaproteobacteria bacterium]